MSHKEKFNKKHGQPLNQSNSLKEISDKTGYKLSGLKVIQEKGEGAYFSSSSSVRPHIKSPEEWGRASVYASINKQSKSYQIDKSHLEKKNKK